jgi:hypothetical protein
MGCRRSAAPRRPTAVECLEEEISRLTPSNSAIHTLQRAALRLGTDAVKEADHEGALDRF